MKEKNFKVLFIVPDFNYVKEYTPDYEGSLSLGVAYISANLKKNGFQTSLIHITRHIEEREFINRVRKEKPNLVAFSFFTHQRADVERYANYIRNAGISTPIIVGGVHPTTNPTDSMKIKGVDYVCIGEGEYPVVDLARAILLKKDTTKIKNIWARKNGKIIKNDVRPLIKNLDELPFPDRELFNYQNLIEAKEKVLGVLATRGCPYNCTYCCNHVYQKIYKGKGEYVRIRDPKFVIKEIREAVKKYPWIRAVRLADDAFCLDIKNVEKLCKLFKEETGLALYANTRVNLINEKLASILSDGGCKGVAIGIESGNQQIREKILRRFMTNEQIKNAIEILHRYKISIITYNILGLPEETLENALETIKLNAYCKSDSYHVSIFQPYPNTDLHDYCKKHGMIDNDEVGTFFTEYKLKNNKMSEKEVMFAYKYFYIYVKLYRIFGNIRIMEKILDSLFLSRKTHKIQMVLYPVAFLLTNPALSVFRTMMRISPVTARKVVEKFHKK